MAARNFIISAGHYEFSSAGVYSTMQVTVNCFFNRTLFALIIFRFRNGRNIIGIFNDSVTEKFDDDHKRIYEKEIQ